MCLQACNLIHNFTASSTKASSTSRPVTQSSRKSTSTQTVNSAGGQTRPNGNSGNSPTGTPSLGSQGSGSGQQPSGTLYTKTGGGQPTNPSPSQGSGGIQQTSGSSGGQGNSPSGVTGIAQYTISTNPAGGSADPNNLSNSNIYFLL